MAEQQAIANDFAIEPHGIEHIPEDQRHGSPANQFTIRFAPVVYLAAIVLGGVSIPLGLGLTGTVTAILAGNILGAIATAACATMGPRLGMPQIIMGRAAFGYRGNYAPAVLTSFLYIGYYTVGTVLGSKALADLVGLPYVPVAIAVAVLSIVIATYGYNLLHFFGRWITRISIVVLLVVSVYLIAHGAGDGAHGRLSGSDYWLVWLLEFTIVFSYTMSWAPYASDYSRYLPVRTSRRKIFWWAFAGLFTSTTWMMVLGAALTTVSVKGGALDAFDVVLPVVMLKIVLTTLGLSAIPHNSVNLYSFALSSLSWDLPMRRTVAAVGGGVVGCVLAVAFGGGDDFQKYFDQFLFLISYYIMPWLAIVCVDFFAKHRGGHGYPPADAFYRTDGVLGGIKWPGLVAWVVGIAVSVPFMATDLFTGPIGHALDGADLSYFVSFLVAALIYYGASRRAAKSVTADPVGSLG
jgi:nucleobase:cation symporter-1, NCS1 family